MDFHEAPAQTSLPTRGRAGRPRKSEGPRVNYAEVDQLIVFGEPGSEPGQAVRYPSYRELAARYGVAPSVIAEYASKNKCQRRRKYAAGRIRTLADKRLIELHAEAKAHGHLDRPPTSAGALHDARQAVVAEITASDSTGAV